ncbi:unnamed protein product [Durusdinium trenchii]|uniref:DNA-directed RNA polymerase n=1 Tax=Durusdinium trenchii TaxID=1381693 RepID=A0ABP0H7N9_9DINO
MAFPRAAGWQPRLQRRPLPEDDEPPDHHQGTTADDPPQTYRMDSTSHSYEFTTHSDASTQCVCQNCGHDGFRFDRGQWHCTECGHADYRASAGAFGQAGWFFTPQPSTAQHTYERAQYYARPTTTPFRTTPMGTMPNGGFREDLHEYPMAMILKLIDYQVIILPIAYGILPDSKEYLIPFRLMATRHQEEERHLLLGEDHLEHVERPQPGVKFRGGAVPPAPQWHYEKGDLRAYQKWEKRVRMWMLQVQNYVPIRETGILLFQSLKGELEEELEDARGARLLERARLSREHQRQVLIGAMQTLDFDTVKDVMMFQWKFGNLAIDVMQFNSFEHVHLWQSFSKDLRHLVKRTMEWARRAQRFLRAPLAISSTPSTATPKRKAKAKAAPVAQVTAPLAGPACDHRRIKRSGNRHGSYTVHGAQEEMEVDSKAGVLRHSIGFLTVAPRQQAGYLEPPPLNLEESDHPEEEIDAWSLLTVLTVEHQIYADLPPAKDVPKFDVAVTQKQLIANSEPGQVRKGRIQEGPPLSFRSLTGPIQWLAGSTRTGCLGLIGQQRERHRASLLNSMPPWTTQLTFQDVAINQVATTIVGYADSSWANAAQCASQQGCIVLLTTPLCTQVITKGNIVDWRSNRSSRVCRSTLAAESIACDDCVDRAHYVLLVLNELLTGTAFHRDPKKWKLQQPQVTDCRSLFDAATPFTRVTVKDISSRLHDMGFQRFGNEKVWNGHTGRPLTNKIFAGPVYYQRLKHMVSDKVQSRSRGPVQTLTRQPTEGRAKEGGLRFGEMERDCIISHGAAKFLKERLFDVSDAHRVHVCDTCGLFAIAKLKNDTYECKLCKDKAKVSQICLPYACKLMIQELMTMNILPRLVLHATQLALIMKSLQRVMFPLFVCCNWPTWVLTHACFRISH